MTSNEISEPSSPLRGPGWIWAAAVLGGLLLAVVFSRDAGRVQPQLAPGGAQVALRFVDSADGCVDVLRAGDGQRLQQLCGEQGFLRGVVRSLVRERARRGLSAAAPFTLLARAGGGLTLLDEGSGQHIELDSFGPSNVAVFAPWLSADNRHP